MGYHDRARHPELLDVRDELRAPGPHVRAERVVEPARAPLHGLGVVGALREHNDPFSCVNALAGPDTRRTRRSTRRARRSSRGPTSPTCCTRTTCRGATTSSTGTEPDCEDDAAIAACAAAAERDDARHLEPAARTSTRSSRTASSATSSRSRALLRRGARPARCPRCRGSSRRNAISEHPPAVDQRRARRTSPSLVNAVMREPRLGLDRDLPRRGTTGAASTTTSCRRRSTRTATACACPGS